MPTFLGAIADSEIKVRHKEPFLTAGLNEKQAVVSAPGIYRGFKLAPGVANYEITVDPDPATTDHVGVYESATGYSMRVRRTGGAFTLDLTALANKTVVLAIYAEYALSKDTTAVIRAYELFPVDEFTGAAEKDELLVMGVGVVPAAPAPVTNIAPTYRTPAWERVAPGVSEWAQFVENGGFEACQLGTATAGSNAEPWPGWDTYNGLLELNGAQYSVVNTQARTGDHSLRLALSGNPNQQASLYYGGMMQVRPGQFLHASLWAMGVLVAPGPSGVGGLGLRFNFWTKTFASAGTAFVADDTLTGSFSWQEIEEIIEVPATAAFAEVYVYYHDNNQSSTGDFYIDDVRLWAEVGDPTDDSTDEDDGFQGSKRTLSLDLAPSPPYTSLGDFLDKMVRLRSQGGSPVQDILMGCRDGASLFNLILRFGGLEIDRKITRLGLTLLGSAADAAIPRIQMPVFPAAGTPYVLLWEADNSVSGAAYLRCYATEDSGITGINESLIFTVNAEWDGTQWQADVPAQGSLRMELEAGGLRLYERVAGAASPWADAAWGNRTGDLIVVPGACFVKDATGVPAPQWTNTVSALFPDVGGAQARLSLTAVPDGAVIEEVRVWVNQGGVNPLTAKINLTTFVSGGGAPTDLTLVTGTSAGPGQDEIRLIAPTPGMPVTVAKGPVPATLWAYHLEVDAASPLDISDRLYGALIRYTSNRLWV
jgi:hypothetical protein